VAIGLGSNLGDRAASIARAARLVEQITGLTHLRVSGLYQTAPVRVEASADPGGTYLNAVATARCTLAPLELLDALLATERTLGRDRATQAHGQPRVIDLDLLLYADCVLRTDRLTLPHPGLAERLFVLAPLAELVPDFYVPVAGRYVYELRGLARVCCGDEAVRPWLA
jgi:2-amino-4-hydroxy-6-hydroxymethyldihydropteridine diphosphokinase